MTPAPDPASTAAGAEALPPDAVEVARVLGAWGVKGGIKVKPHAADVQALFSSKRWYLQPATAPRPPGAAAARPLPALLRVVQARGQGDLVVATVQELADRDAAEALLGARIFISRGSFPTPGEGEFYWVDLVGLTVVNRQGLTLGRVVGLIETGPHCVLRLSSLGEGPAEDKDEVLIPFVDAYVDKVDLPGRCIAVDWDPSY